MAGEAIVLGELRPRRVLSACAVVEQQEAGPRGCKLAEGPGLRVGAAARRRGAPVRRHVVVIGGELEGQARMAGGHDVVKGVALSRACLPIGCGADMAADADLGLDGRVLQVRHAVLTVFRDLGGGVVAHLLELKVRREPGFRAAGGAVARLTADAVEEQDVADCRSCCREQQRRELRRGMAGQATRLLAVLVRASQVVGHAVSAFAVEHLIGVCVLAVVGNEFDGLVLAQALEIDVGLEAAVTSAAAAGDIAGDGNRSIRVHARRQADGYFGLSSALGTAADRDVHVEGMGAEHGNDYQGETGTPVGHGTPGP